MRAASVLNRLLLAALWLGSAAAWPHLPARIPTHFGISGTPDRWVQTSVLSWFGLPLLATAVVLLNTLLVGWLPRYPHLFNMPDKQRFLALPPRYQMPVIQRMQAFVHALSAQVTLLFGLIQIAIFQVARGAQSQSYMLLVMVLGVAVLPLLALWGVVRIQDEVARQVRLHSGSTTDTP